MNMTDTTLQGVPEDPTIQAGDDAASETRERPVNPREQRLAEIAARRAQERDEEAGNGEAMLAEEGAREAAAAPAAAEKPAAAAVAAEGLPQALKLKVDGAVVEISQEEALRRLQKDVAADRRLADATRILRDAQTQKEEAERLHQELQSRLASVKALPETPQSAADEQAIQELADALIDGRIEEAKKGLKALMGRQPATPDVTQIAAVVETNVKRSLIAERERDAQQSFDQQLVEGLNQFREKFPDIANDPRLFAYANAESDLIAAENPGLSPAEIFARAGERVSQMVQPKQQTSQTRQGLKTLLERPVRGASSAASLGESPKPPATVSSVIQKMREARGQK